jgi:heme-degrading monooxygenase HmoA
MIHVLIERHIAEGLLSTYKELSRQAMHRTYMAPGFIAGESFDNTADGHHRFVLCKWRSLKDWDLWVQSAERQELMNRIGPTLSGPEKVLILKN